MNERRAGSLPYANMTTKTTNARAHSNLMQKTTRATAMSIKVGAMVNSKCFGNVNLSVVGRQKAHLQRMIYRSPPIKNTENGSSVSMSMEGERQLK